MPFLSTRGSRLASFSPLIASLIFVSTTTQADDLQHEFIYDYTKYDIESSFGDDTDINHSFRYLYHFSPLDTDKGPYNELSFANKSSYFHASIRKQNGYDDLRLSLGGEWTNKDNGFVFGASTSWIDSDLADTANISLNAGLYITDNLRILGHTSFDTDRDYITYGLNVKSLTELSGDSALEWHGQLSIFDPDDDSFFIDSTHYNIGATYYFNQAFGLGVDYHYTETDDSDFSNSRYTLSTNYYLNASVGLTASYGFSETDDDDEPDGFDDDTEGNVFSLGVNFRF